MARLWKCYKYYYILYIFTLVRLLIFENITSFKFEAFQDEPVDRLMEPIVQCGCNGLKRPVAKWLFCCTLYYFVQQIGRSIEEADDWLVLCIISKNFHISFAKLGSIREYHIFRRQKAKTYMLFHSWLFFITIELSKKKKNQKLPLN